MYIAICYFAPINYTFYQKKNLDKNCPYKNLEQDIYNLKNEGNILLLGDFNVGTKTKKATIGLSWVPAELVGPPTYFIFPTCPSTFETLIFMLNTNSNFLLGEFFVLE
jgi:hypothetical protein